MATALLFDNPNLFATFPLGAPLTSRFFVGNLSSLLIRKFTASNESRSLLCTIPFPASVMTVEAEQTPRRVLASRHLLFAAVGVPRLDSAPGRKRGAELKTRGGSAASVGRRLCSAASGG